MNYGLYLSASGVLTNQYRQDVFANNLANVATPAFKPDVPVIKQRDPETIEDHLGGRLSQRLLERLGGGVLAGPQRIDLSVGPFEQTGNPLDVALPDKDTFFAVEWRGGNGADTVRLTRDGRFTRNAAGELVTPSGQRVLDADGQPITVPAVGDVRFDAAGRLLHNGEPVARLQVARVPDQGSLRKTGGNLFAFNGPDPREPVANPSVLPGKIESSGVNPVRALMDVTSAGKSAMGNAEMIRYFDLLMDRSVNSLGRVA